MESASQFLIAIGGILVLGMATDLLGRRTFLPRITLLLIFGIIIGQNGFDLIPDIISNKFELIADVLLLIVGFLLGGMLTRDSLSKAGDQMLWISISGALVTTLVVFSGLLLIGTPTEIALLLGCIASATAPAATLDTVMESGEQGPFSKLLLAIVALDDAWGIILFSICIALVSVMNGHSETNNFVYTIVADIGGAILVGVLIGFPAAYLTGRIKPGQPMLTEALAVVFLCGGIALWLNVSFLIAAIVLGAVVANFAKHHEYPFNAIEGVEWPLMVIFFVLAGASLEISALQSIGTIGAVFIICRIAGKLLGSHIGSRISGANKITQRWIGVALLPQAGAAMGMALVAANQFPEYRQILLSVVISTTIFFEIIGPPLTKLALDKTKDQKLENK